MTNKYRQIEIPAETADLLEARASARGLSIAELIADLAENADLPAPLDALRRAGQGPWAPEVLEEDARRLAAFKRTRNGVPRDEVRRWMQSRGTREELPPPRLRKL